MSPLLNHKEETGRTSTVETTKLDECHIRTSNPKICLQVEWIQTPQVNTDSPFRFRLTTQDHVSVQPQGVDVDLWMPDMGHGSAPVIVESTDRGYLVKDVFFIMPGLWQVRFRITSDSGETLEAALEITL